MPFKSVATKSFPGLEQLVDSRGVVVFSKSYCPYCSETKSLFKELGVQARVMELDLIPGGSEIHEALAAKTGQRTVPYVFVNSTFVGGNDHTQKAHRSGELRRLLEAAT
jgi:glutaredoxin 3